MLVLKGWRYVAVVGGLTGLIFAAIYPTIIDPYFHPEKWQKIQKVAREGINREDIQPGEKATSTSSKAFIQEFFFDSSPDDF